MQVINSEMIAGWDVDDTLVMWDNPTVDGPGKVKIEFAGGFVYLTPHNYHIQLLKVHRERGFFNIIWSANGKAHAKRVIEALGLEDAADMVMSKLVKHFDDSTGSVAGIRVYVDDLTKPPVVDFSPWSNAITVPNDTPYSGTVVVQGGTYRPFGGTSG